MKYGLLATALLFGLLAIACGRKPSANSTADLERKFQEMMSGVTLVGHSAGPHQTGLSDEERYVIDKVSRLSGDTWLFQTRLHFSGHDYPVPVPVQIKWAGD